MPSRQTLFARFARFARESFDVLYGRRCRICKTRLLCASAAGLCDKPACLEEAEFLQVFGGI